MKLKKSLIPITLAFSVFFTFSSITILPKNTGALSGSEFNAGRIIDDSVFYNANSMSVQQIQEFLNSKVPVCDTNGSQIYSGSTTRAQYSASRGYPAPYVCLKDYSQSVPAITNGGSDLCKNSITGGTKSSAQIIKDVSVACGINPQVLIVLLQKEQSLISDDWPWPIQYRSATGYGCPDTAPCDAEFYGFFNQVYQAAKAFRRYEANPNSYNYKANRNNTIYYNPNLGGCGSSNVFIQNQATASLYIYTPYQPNAAALNNLYGTGDSCSAYGNRNFWRMYSDWFGSTVGSYCFYGPAGVSSTDIAFRKLTSKVDQANLTIYNGTSTNCIESHAWQVGLQSWEKNTATNHPVVTNNNSAMLYGDIDGDGIDNAMLASLSATGSGKVEFHLWNKDMTTWQDHIVSQVSPIDPTKGKFIFADVDGNGVDEAVLILFAGTGSGNIEFHVLNNDLRTWRWHIATQVPVLVNSADANIQFADLDGDKVDEPILILLNGSASTKVEFHTWGPGWWYWRFNTASNQPSVNPLNNRVLFADVDGNGVDEAVLVGLRGTGSGRVEFHTWNPGVGSWRFNTASNQPGL